MAVDDTKKHPLTVGCSLTFLCVASGLLGAVIVSNVDVDWTDGFQIDFAQSISIILSALGVILTALAILIGVISVIGWSSFSNQLRQGVNDKIEEDVDKKGPLFSTISEKLEETLLEKLPDELIAKLVPILEARMYAGVGPEDEPATDPETVGDQSANTSNQTQGEGQ